MMEIKKIVLSVLHDYELESVSRKLKQEPHKNVFYFGEPNHSNMGDQAQTYCILNWIKENYPDYKVWCFRTGISSVKDFELLKIIKRYIKNDDKIFLQSGYNTTDLYLNEELLHRRVIQEFPQNEIVLFPQTIYFKSEEEAKKSSQIYNKHDRIVLLCRDNISYGYAQNLFPKCKKLLFPDVVTTMIGNYKSTVAQERKGVLFCMRNDKESACSLQQINKLKQSLSQFGPVEQTDTTIALSRRKIAKNREKILHQIWDSYAQYRLIVTDRYHGTIFSLIANTPVIVLPSTDHKLVSGVKWFPEEYSDYVNYVENFEEVETVAKRILEIHHDYRLKSYFKEVYYDKLKEYIEGDKNEFV